MAESTAIVKVTPISGSRQDSAPACYLLEIDQAKILLDCGSTEAFSIEHLHGLKRLTRHLDLILLTHGDLAHCGALPWLFSQLTEENSSTTVCPILATVPVYHLGLITLYDAMQNYEQATGKVPSSVTLDAIDRAFESITKLKYSQPYTCASGPAKGITLTPLPAGYTLGGAIWRIRRLTEDIFYAGDFNHKREMLLDGAALDIIQRPSLLIASARGALDVHPARKQRDTSIVDACFAALKAGGSVLIPCDSASRSLELLLILESFWNTSRSSSSSPFPILFVSHQSERTLQVVRGMIEWMAQSTSKVFEQDRSNPFDLKHIRTCHDLTEVNAVTGPKLILASGETLNGGFSGRILESILANAASLALFISKPQIGSVGERVLNAAKGSKLLIDYFEQVPLEGAELEAFRQAEREEAERVAAEVAFAEMQRNIQEEEDEESDDDEDGDAPLGNRRVSEAAQSRRLARKIEQEQINSAVALRHVFWTDYRTDWYVDPDSLPARLRQSAPNDLFYPLIPPTLPLAHSSGIPIRHQMFPFREVRRQADNYGETVDPKEFAGFDSVVPSNSPVPQAFTATPSPQPSQAMIKPKSTTNPTKWQLFTAEVTIKCSRKCLDFSGISDGKSLKTIYARIQPRRLVLIGGSSDATDYLHTQLSQTVRTTASTASSASSSQPAMQVYAPAPLESVIVSAAVNVMQAVLSEALVAQVNLQLLGDYEVAQIRGHFRLPEEGEAIDAGSAMQVDSVGPSSHHQSLPILEPLSDDAVVGGETGMFLGDPRLSELRKAIASELNIPAVFQSGDLICGSSRTGRIAIRRDPDSGGLLLEGPLTQDYFALRSLLHSTMAFI